MKSKHFVIFWLPLIIWAGVIFTFSSIPTAQTSKIYLWDFIIKKSAHVIEYAILFFLFFRASSQKHFKVNINNLKDFLLPKNKLTTVDKKSIFFIFLICLFYAISDEYHQSFVPGRTAKVRDIGFDLLGLILSFSLIKKKTILENVKTYS